LLPKNIPSPSLPPVVTAVPVSNTNQQVPTLIPAYQGNEGAGQFKVYTSVPESNIPVSSSTSSSSPPQMGFIPQQQPQQKPMMSMNPQPFMPSPSSASPSNNSMAHLIQQQSLPQQQLPTQQQSPPNSMILASSGDTSPNQQLVRTSPYPDKSAKYIDLTDFLALPQTEAARRLGIPTSTLSKRWKEAVVNRKWPYRMVCKLNKEIMTLLHNVPQGPGAPPLPPEVEQSLGLLLRKRQEELRGVVIRI